MSFFMGARKIPSVPLSPRQIIMARDFREMEQLRKESTIIEFEATGKPPDRYKIVFHGKCLVPGPGGAPALGDLQEIEIALGSEYPRAMPQPRWITKIIHPNISMHGNVCFGTFAAQWTTSLHLTDLVEILWDYSRLKTLNPSHGNYSGRAINWGALAEKYFPRGEGVDERALRDLLVGKNKGSSMIAPPAAAGDLVIFPDDEGKC